MSLRDQLKRAAEVQLHVATPRVCNRATQPPCTQLRAQLARNQPAAIPVIGELLRATDDATAVQLGSCNDDGAPDQALHEEPSHEVLWLQSFGADQDDAERLAGWMRIRDLDADDRRLCVECWHFANHGMYCRHPRRLAIDAPRDLGALALIPQRCVGFQTR